jgi:uncharacterized membrane protein YGL010W
MKQELVDHFECYADYHRHPINRLTHKIAIPLIVFHIVAMLDWVRLLVVPGWVTVTLAHVVYVAAIAWYFTLHARLAAMMAVVYAACFPIGWYTPWQAVVAIAVFAWIIQLAGHVIWEKRQPAFFTNLIQALIGPLFFIAILAGEWPVRDPGRTAEEAQRA